MHPKWSGNSGRYFMVRNWLSEKGLSSETCGRLCVFVTPSPLDGAEQLADVPAPQLIGSSSHQFRLLVRRMKQLIAAFVRFVVFLEHAIHGADRAVIRSFIEQRRVNSGW